MRQFGRDCLNNQPSIMQERAFGTVSGHVLPTAARADIAVIVASPPSEGGGSTIFSIAL